MEKTKFIYQVETEPHFTVMIRILAAFNRRRIPIIEMQASIKNGEDRQLVMLSVLETKENAIKISRKLEQEVDVFTVHLFEQSNQN